MVIINKTTGGGWVAYRWGRGGHRGDARRVRVDAIQAQFWAGIGTAGRQADMICVWVGALGLHFCSCRPKRTQTDEMGRPTGVALSDVLYYFELSTVGRKLL